MAGSSPQFNAKQAKIAVIPLLGAVLLYFVFGSRGDQQRPAAERAAASVAATQGVDSIAAAPPAVKATTVAPRSWPNRPLSEILKHDPFRVSMPVAPTVFPSLAENAEAVRDLEQQREVSELIERLSRKVPDLVLRSSRGISAVIDGQTVREGDILEGAARVVAIRPEGIVFELVD